ncbi:hypothetical protein HNR37_000640 [Desulfurispira natronophila]|uniref:Uncharacterized protein n=1 Tax=Desulfurispira natronophila TaxID=682562 RepID=A0A7W8DGC0_9BACT|nr:hypothetical protein [Desulfurispira natronophila]
MNSHGVDCYDLRNGFFFQRIVISEPMGVTLHTAIDLFFLLAQVDNAIDLSLAVN